MVWPLDAFPLVAAVNGLSQSVAKIVFEGPDGRDSADLCEALTIQDGLKLADCIRATP